MIKKTIEFEDFNGNKVSQDHYFHISASKLAELEMTADEDVEMRLRRIVSSNDKKEILKTFKDILKLGYGTRSEDGTRFIQSDELWEEFTQSIAFDTLLFGLFTNAIDAAELVGGMLPGNLAEQAKAAMSGRPDTDTRSAWIREGREPTKHELASMTKEQLVEAMQSKNNVRGG
jgi:hypothetical protein